MNLEELRKVIDEINDEIIALFAKRLRVAKEIAQLKKRENLPILDVEREKKEMLLISGAALRCGLKPEVLKKIFGIYIDYTREEMQ